MQAVTNSPTALNKFCTQLNEFCLLFQQEILRLESTPGRPPSAQRARAFAESLILCPTPEATRVCIRRDMAGARSFLVVADAVLKEIRSRNCQFALQEPEYQTKFYLLACAIDEFLQTRREPFRNGQAPVCTGT